MPGHMGQVQRTVQNLRVVQVLAEKNLLLIKGSFPGATTVDDQRLIALSAMARATGIS